ncbi:putative lipopolysaccharide heptosyltransferase III [Erwiniaceae bacterium BAC15a-03b]|uniref:Lipopolysaccharide heptosyltransferase 3 n=1 Tax=Winslowiella arboricola TaxID=2978220 RepID=A0A9J6PLC6_9GAMM|nr:putative lipopolysaccharide heptosyltransferase III [Winslowiella arboricola]MCU5773531.1 putative lipopolysaccharide heptosyltransferase III [Winslowiella arboricola]MCU5776557.1 putative lipopolysaccharide heptosyltransferase III [Winslowiella arboricola]
MASPIPSTFTPRKILLIKLRHHGDMLLTTPVINALHQRYPQAIIDVLLYAETRPILQAHPAIGEIHAIDRNWKKLGGWQRFKHEMAVATHLRSRHYDVVINLADQWLSAIITRLSGASVRIGFDFEKRRNPLWQFCHNYLVPTDNHHQLHTAEQNLSALQPLNIPVAGVHASMHYSDSDWQHTKHLLAQQFSQPYIVIQPTSRWIFKCWEDDKMAEVIDQLARPGLKVVLTAAPDAKEQAMIDNILSLCKSGDVVSIAGKLTLTQLAALIAHARLFIGVDSAPMHMAAALNTPCIALFGPTKLQFWRPWGENNQVIWAGDYAPLPDPDSINTNTQQRYLTAIPVEDVVKAARSYLDE